MKEFEGRKRRMLTTGEWCDSVSKMSQYMKNGDRCTLYRGLSTRGLRIVIVLTTFLT